MSPEWAYRRVIVWPSADPPWGRERVRRGAVKRCPRRLGRRRTRRTRGRSAMADSGRWPAVPGREPCHERAPRPTTSTGRHQRALRLFATGRCQTVISPRGPSPDAAPVTSHGGAEGVPSPPAGPAGGTRTTDGQRASGGRVGSAPAAAHGWMPTGVSGHWLVARRSAWGLPDRLCRDWAEMSAEMWQVGVREGGDAAVAPAGVRRHEATGRRES